jgi:hypothetical protein
VSKEAMPKCIASSTVPAGNNRIWVLKEAIKRPTDFARTFKKGEPGAVL